MSDETLQQAGQIPGTDAVCNLPASKTQPIASLVKNKAQDTEKTQVICTARLTAPGAADSHPGFKRHMNEDSYGYSFNNEKGIAFFAVADGIGGHGAGDFASAYLVQNLLAFWRKYQENIPAHKEQIVEDVVQKIREINARMYELNVACSAKLPMGTTLALLILVPEFSIIIHLGDSRIYMVRQHTITQLTQDHSYVNEMIRSGALTPEQAAVHPLAHVILRSVGPVAEIEPETQIIPRIPGDRFLLCSDGLTIHLTDEDILRCVDQASSPADAVRSAIHATLRAGANDNVTVVCSYF